MNLAAFIPAGWPIDWIILSAVAILIALDAMRAGTARAATLSLALPLALLLYAGVAHTAILSSINGLLATPLSSGIVFVVIAGMLYLFIRQMLGLWSSEVGGPLPATLAGLACTAILVLVWLQVPALESLWHFGTQVQNVFSQSYQLFWYLGAYATLAYTRS